MKQFAYLLLLLILSCSSIVETESEQEKILDTLPETGLKTYIFGHSLINHAIPTVPTVNNETSVPHWMFLLSEEAGVDYSVSGQYGFLPQHDDLPPTAQWGFDIVPGAWDSDVMEFSEVDFNTILLTAGNFIQYQPATTNYDGDANDTSPLLSTLTITDWVTEQEPGIKIYIYENWPDMAPFISSFPPTAQEFSTYNSSVTEGFHDWWIDYHDEVLAARPNQNVRMIPVGPIISGLLEETVLCNIPFVDLYEDDAPHGRPTIYYLASMITYMAMYQERTPEGFITPDTVNSLINENYTEVVDYIWEALENFDDESGNSRVW